MSTNHDNETTDVRIGTFDCTTDPATFHDAAYAEPFPLDYTAFKNLFRGWLAGEVGAGRMTRTSYQFPGRNFMADEVLGVWSRVYENGTGLNVELSMVTFPGIGYRAEPVRYVGITIGDGGGRWVPRNGLVRTFDELAAELADPRPA